MKTSELTDAALDRAVAKAAGYSLNTLDLLYDIKCYSKFNPSTNWAQGGPIIEREGIEVRGKAPNCYASYPKYPTYHGPTPLIAAMRCYVASKLGDEVEVSHGQP